MINAMTGGQLESDFAKRRQRMVEIDLKGRDIRDADVLAVVDRALEQMQRLTQLLSGILHGEPGAKFDTIANLEILGGGENALISSAWEKTLKSMNRGANLLRDIRDLEKD